MLISELHITLHKSLTLNEAFVFEEYFSTLLW